MEGFIQTPLAQFMLSQNIPYLAPELIILTALLFALFQSFAKSEADQHQAWWLSFLGVLFAMGCAALHFTFIYNNDPAGQPVLFGMFKADLYSLVFRFLMLLGSAITLLLSKQYLSQKAGLVAEFYVLLLSALLGGMLLAGAADIMMLFVALETLGISSYILAGYLRGNIQSTEAALKYLLYGGTATAVLLFGLSLFYGASGGQTGFTELAMGLSQAPQSLSFLLPIAGVMVIAGFAFKLSAAPFHMWTPDVYEGAPTPVSAFLSVVSKLAGFAVTIRFLSQVLAHVSNGVLDWFPVLAAVSVLSMTLGNLLALRQGNIKRLLAYSTIAHAGYMLLGVLVLGAQSIQAYASMVFYLMTYLFMNLGAFAVAIHMSNLTGREDIAAYAGLIRKRPVLTFAFTLFLLSLAGIPVTAGFFAKFFLFQAVGALGTQYLWLVGAALLNSTISLYYYLNVVKTMVIADPSDVVQSMPAETAKISSAMGLSLAMCLAGTLVLGFFAQPAFELSERSVQSLYPTGMALLSSSIGE